MGRLWTVLAALAWASFTYFLGVSPGEAAVQSARDRVHPALPWRERGRRWMDQTRSRWPGYGPQVQHELDALGIVPARYLQELAFFGGLGALIIGVDVSWWLLPVGLIVGAAGTRFYLQWRYQHWLQRCVGQVGDLVTLLKARMQAGDTVVKAMAGVTPQLMAPLAQSWQRGLDALQSGQSLFDVMTGMKQRLPDRDITAVLNQLVIYDRDSVPQDPFGTLSGHLARMKLLKRDYLIRQATGSLSLFEGAAFMGALLSVGVPLVYLFWTHTLSGGIL